MNKVDINELFVILLELKKVIDPLIDSISEALKKKNNSINLKYLKLRKSDKLIINSLSTVDCGSTDFIYHRLKLKGYKSKRNVINRINFLIKNGIIERKQKGKSKTDPSIRYRIKKGWDNNFVT